MKWVTRRFVAPEEVAAFQAREGATGFDARVAGDDSTMLERASLMYDGLYAHLTERERP
jgi:hypothetical protein